MHAHNIFFKAKETIAKLHPEVIGGAELYSKTRGLGGPIALSSWVKKVECLHKSSGKGEPRSMYADILRPRIQGILRFKFYPQI